MEKMAFGTKEWAETNFNFCNGCTNDCVYCYAKEMAIRFKRKTNESWKKMELKEVQKESCRHREGLIMLPSSHDITTENIDLAIMSIDNLIKAENKILIVSKPDYECIVYNVSIG